MKKIVAGAAVTCMLTVFYQNWFALGIFPNRVSTYLESVISLYVVFRAEGAKIFWGVFRAEGAKKF